MPTKTKKKGWRPPATTHANIKLLAVLHETMKAIRQARHDLEGTDVKLCRIYSEAVEQYITAEPQQRLLKELEVKAATG